MGLRQLTTKKREKQRTRFEGRTALVTGAGRGIGRAIAEAFASEGANVVACDRDPASLERVGAALTSQAAQHLECLCDVSGARDVQETVAAAVAEFGAIDVLVNNAGVSHIAPFLDMDDEMWDRTIAVNLRGAYLLCKAVLPHMLAAGRGKIVNMSSQSGKTGNSQYAAYCASKFAIIGMTQSLALEFADRGININAVCPGVVFTPLWEAMLPDYARKRNMRPEEVKPYLESKIPLGRLGEPEDVAKAVLFLASEESNYMTGQAINVTGGADMY